MKHVAVIACYDTKYQEIDYLMQAFRQAGNQPFLIDISVSPGFHSSAAYPREEIVREIGLNWDEVVKGTKSECIDAIGRAAKQLVTRLYREGKIDAAISIGGLQNTIVGAKAMQALPIGIPKVMVSTVACGQRKFDLVVGRKDITVIPSIVDFGSLNKITCTVLNNAVGAVNGMLEHAGREIPKDSEPLIATTLMGATNDGVENAVESLRAKNYAVACFHSTGVGGQMMEEFIDEGIVTAAMDLTLHEIVYEYFGSGFGYGTQNRLSAGIRKGIPMVVCSGGIDFICVWKEEMTPELYARKYVWHNPTLAHVKLNVKEVTDISRMIVSRLNEAIPGRVVVLMPRRGLRSLSGPGEPLYDPEVNDAILKTFETGLKADVPILYADASLMDRSFSEFAAAEMIKQIEKCQVKR